MKKLFANNPFLQALLVVAIVLLLYKLRIIVLVVFVAFLLATILHPLTAALQKRRWPTALAVLVPLLVILTIIGALFYLLLPPFLSSLANFAEQLPDLLSQAAQKLHLKVDTNQLHSLLSSRFGSISHYALLATQKALTIFAGVLTIVVLTVYWLGSYDTVKREVLALFKGRRRQRLSDIWDRIEIKLRHWIKAHLMLNTIVGLLVWIGLTALGIPFASLLAFIAFLVEIIPTAGPLLAAAPAIALGLAVSLPKGLAVGLYYLVVQQIESHILSPLLLGRTVQLHPIIIIVSLLVGVEVLGIAGALVAVPVALCISSAVDSYREQPPEIEPSVFRRLGSWFKHPSFKR